MNFIQVTTQHGEKVLINSALLATITLRQVNVKPVEWAPAVSLMGGESLLLETSASREEAEEHLLELIELLK